LTDVAHHINAHVRRLVKGTRDLRIRTIVVRHLPPGEVSLGMASLLAGLLGLFVSGQPFLVGHSSGRVAPIAATYSANAGREQPRETDPPLTRRGVCGFGYFRKCVVGVGGADGNRTHDVVNAIDVASELRHQTALQARASATRSP
jgi:hypothetical protein